MLVSREAYLEFRISYLTKKDLLSKIKRTCAIDAKIMGFLGVRFQLSRCGGRGKIFFKILVFGVGVGALLIDMFC